MVRARVRDLIGNFPYFTSAANITTDHTVVIEVRFQFKVKDAKVEVIKPLADG